MDAAVSITDPTWVSRTEESDRHRNICRVDRTVVGLDFGDAPDPSYPTFRANDGARHVLFGTGSFFLGSSPADPDSDGQPDTEAEGDDSTDGDDEEGITFVNALRPGSTGLIGVVASDAQFLDAWIDFDGDGRRSAAEKLVFDDPGGRQVAAGTLRKFLEIPVEAVPGRTFARFRLSSSESELLPTGIAAVTSATLTDGTATVTYTCPAAPRRRFIPSRPPTAAE